MGKVFKIFLALLALSALILAYLLYTRDNSSLFREKSTENASISEKGAGATPAIYGAGEGEKTILRSPPSGASAEEQQDFAELLKSSAEQASYLELGASCAAKPLVFSLREGTPFRVKNSTGAAQELIFNDTAKFKISAGETKDLALSFARAGGIYAYGCSAFGGVAGRIFVTK